MRIVLTGIAGRLGRRMALLLHEQGHHVVGIDKRPCLGLPDGIEHHRVDLRRRTAHDVFAAARPEAVVHMGVVHNFRIPAEVLNARNVIGTDELLKLVIKFDVSKMVLLSSGDVYGPSAANSHFIGEDAPLLASQRFPEVRTLVAVDRAVQSFFWRYPEVQTVILRPAHIVGENVRNAPSNYLRLRVIPTQMGFDPMVQLTREADVCQALLRALEPSVRGVYNLASTQPVPLSHIFRVLNRPVLPIPHPIFSGGLKRLWRWGLTTFPPPELDHIRFSSVLDTRRAEKELGVLTHAALKDVLAPFVLEPPVRAAASAPP
jgi:UDP-glucose 4-epimerase